MKNILGINWNLKYRLEKGKNEILRMKIDILRKRLSKYENLQVAVIKRGNLLLLFQP